ncbi:hypothetical protein KP509_09G004100 [Ceratopteris richardii]|nr:hypothetical protein KP509_09G004100 [Ceratopteris richardii]
MPSVIHSVSDAKRLHADSRSSSVHLSLLQELCDLEGDDADGSFGPSTSSECGQEDLVAEMMKSLEKVIQTDAVETCNSETTEISSGILSSGPASALECPTESDSCRAPSDVREYPAHTQDGEASPNTIDADVHIRHILHASDDELGIPAADADLRAAHLLAVSTSPSDFDDRSFHEEWASLSDNSGDSDYAVANLNCWFETPFQQFEEPRDLYEPVSLF